MLRQGVCGSDAAKGGDQLSDVEQAVVAVLAEWRDVEDHSGFFVTIQHILHAEGVKGE
jgi:hypothetical protein